MRISNRIALAGVGMFGLVCTAAQFLRRDLDWTAAPLSFYLTGPGGWIVKCAYVALSLALLAIGNGFRSVLAATARSALAPALFAVSAVALPSPRSAKCRRPSTPPVCARWCMASPR